MTKPTQNTEFNRRIGVKRQFITTERIFKSGVLNFFRNAWLSIAATAVMVVALTIILFAVVLNVAARNAIGQLSQNLKVSIYLKDDFTDEQVSALEKKLTENPYVVSVQFISKEEARAKFTENFQSDQKLLEGLTLVGEDTLPASLEVSMNDLSKTGDIEAIAKDPNFNGPIDSITLGKTDARKTIDRAASAQHFITSASIVAASIFTVVSVLIIFNTIRMAIFTRSEEIRIMKLIGATPGYIRGPFLVEASVYGVIAGIIATSAVYSIIYSLGSKVATQDEFKQTYDFFTSPSTIMVCILSCVFVGILVGILSSSLAMEKYLKLKHW